MGTFNWQTFLEDVYRQRYVLVIGSEVMLKADYGNGDSQEYLYNEYDKQKRKNRSLKYSNFVINNPIDEKIVNDELLSLLSTKMFRVVITTTTDDLLERVLREKVWGKEMKVLNFYGSDSDFSDGDSCTRDEFYDTKPILYYAFGKVVPGGRFVDEEEDSKLRVVADWLNQARDGYPSRIYSFLSAKKLITLGCKQNDWLFRFFWYSLRQNVKDLRTGEEAKGKIAIELNEEDESLKDYLEYNGWLYEDNARVFISDFLNRIKLGHENETLKTMLLNSSRGGCFISYASEDFDYAFHLFLALKEAGHKVWLDNEKLLPGADYEDRIRRAINECAVFLPILSQSIQDDYNKGMFDLKDSEKRYYMKEWNMAVDFLRESNHKMIIPVLKDGIDVKSEIYQQTPWMKCGIDRTIYKDGIDSLRKLLKSIK